MCNILNLSTHRILASKAQNLTEDPSYIMSYFSLAAFKVLSFSLAFDSLIIMSPGVGLFELILLGIHLTFLDIYTHAFHQIWEIFSNSFFKFSLCPFVLLSPFGTPTTCMLGHLVNPTRCLGSAHFSSIFFLSVPCT